jgi:hypothetical protein
MMVRNPYGTHGTQDRPTIPGTPQDPATRGGHHPHDEAPAPVPIPVPVPYSAPHPPHEPDPARVPDPGPPSRTAPEPHPAHAAHAARGPHAPAREHPVGGAGAAPGGPGSGPPSVPAPRRALSRGGERAADPFDPVWVGTGLRALAERALRAGPAGPADPVDPAEARADPGAPAAPVGAPAPASAPARAGGEHTGRDEPAGPTAHAARSVNDQLLEALWPWALRTAGAQAARLPPGADRDAVHGEILWEVFQAVRRIDWQRYDVWPALLKARLRAAWSAAARAEDPLTRGERQARTAYLARVEAETQRLGRMLTSAERYAIARRLRPSGGTAPVVLGRRLLSSTGGPGDPGTIVQAATAAPADDDPAALLQRAWLRRAVRSWVAHDLPADLRGEVSALLERDEADHIGHALLRRLAPYATALHRRIDD